MSTKGTSDLMITSCDDLNRSMHSFIKHNITYYLKRNKSHGLGAMHLIEIIKSNHVQLKSRIPLVYSECVLKVGDSSNFSSTC